MSKSIEGVNREGIEAVDKLWKERISYPHNAEAGKEGKVIHRGYTRGKYGLCGKGGIVLSVWTESTKEPRGEFPAAPGRGKAGARRAQKSAPKSPSLHT